MNDTFQYAPDIDSLVRLLAGEPMSKAKRHPATGIQIEQGQTINLDQFPGFSVRYLTEEEKVELKTKKNFRLKCSKSRRKTIVLTLGIKPAKSETNNHEADTAPGAKKKRPRNNIYIATVAGERIEVNVPKRPCWLFESLREAYDLADGLSAKKPTATCGEVPAKYMDQFLRSVPLIIDRKDGIEIDVEEAIKEAIERAKQANLYIHELIAEIASTMPKNDDGNCLDLDHPKRHLQYSHNTPQQRARVYIELYEYFRGRRIDSVTKDEAETYLANLWQIRLLHTKSKKQIGDSTVFRAALTANAVFNFGIKKGHCCKNPFREPTSDLRAKLKCEKEAAGPRKILETDQLCHLFQVAWILDRPMVPLMALAIWAGFRRIELFRGTWRCVNLEKGYVQFFESTIKKGTSTRTFNVCPALLSFFAVFPLHDPTAMIVGISETEYELRLKRILEAAGIPPLGKDGFRKFFTIYYQWNGATHQERQYVCGHKPGSPVTQEHYNGDADRDWADRFGHLTLDKLLGPDVPLERIPPLVSIKGSGYSSSLKKYTVAMERYRQRKAERLKAKGA